MCVCVCVCIYVYIYIHIYIHTHTHTHTYFTRPPKIRNRNVDITKFFKVIWYRWINFENSCTYSSFLTEILYQNFECLLQDNFVLYQHCLEQIHSYYKCFSPILPFCRQRSELELYFFSCSEIDLTCIWTPSPYRAVNTLRLGYKNQSVNLQEPCVLYKGRAYRYPPDVAFYIYFFNKYKYWVF